MKLTSPFNASPSVCTGASEPVCPEFNAWYTFAPKYLYAFVCRIIFGDQRVPVLLTNVFKDGALNAALGVTKLSMSRFRILAVSEMIEVEVLIAPLISSSKSTVSRTAVAAAPTPPPPDKVTRGACVYPLPGSLIATETTCPLKIKAEPCACTPPPGGAAIVTVGGDMYPEPPASILTSLTL